MPKGKVHCSRVYIVRKRLDIGVQTLKYLGHLFEMIQRSNLAPDDFTGEAPGEH